MTGGPPTVGAVLCGGASRRMGRDKALIERDGTAMAVRVSESLRAGGCEEVRAIGGDVNGLGTHGLDVVPDRYPGEGPLGGLASALGSVPTGTVLVVAPCDLLAPDPDTASTLLTVLAGTEGGVDVVVPVVAGRDEWILSAWRVGPEVVAAVADLLASGARRLDAVDAVVTAVRVHDVPATAVADADRPEDLT